MRQYKEIDCPNKATCNCTNKEMQGRPNFVPAYAVKVKFWDKSKPSEILFKTECYAEFTQWQKDHEGKLDFSNGEKEYSMGGIDGL